MTPKNVNLKKNTKKTKKQKTVFLKNQGSDFPALLGFAAPFALLPRYVC